MTGYLIGRTAEMSAARACLLDPDPEPAAFLVLGEPGIGKTALVEEITSDASSTGFMVLRARPVQAEERLSYAGLIDLLGEMPETRIGELPAPQRRALEVALRQREPEQPSHDPLAVSLSVLTLVRRMIEESPMMMMVIDDVQWLDSATERALSYALRRVRGGLRLLFAARDDDTPSLFEEMTNELPSGRVEEIHLSPLSSASLHQIFKEELGVNFPRPLLVKIEQASGGNPFYALEIARAISEGRIEAEPGRPIGVPDDLGRLVAGRLAPLSGKARRLLIYLAAAGEISTSLSHRLLGNDASSAMQEALSAGILEEDDGRLRFTHPLLASSAYSAAGKSELREVHSVLAEATDDIERRAVHLALSAGGQQEAAEQLLEQAAAQAVSRGAPEVAVELLQLACDVSLTPPNSLHRALADASLRAGDATGAEATLEKLIASMQPGPERAEVLLLSAAVAHETSSVERCVALSEQGLHEAGQDPVLRARLYATLAAVTSDDIPKAATYSALAMELLDESEEPDVDSLCLAILTAAENALMAGEGLNMDLVDRALALEPQTSLRVSDRPSAAYGALLKYNDDYVGARLWLDKTKQSIEEEGDEGGIPYVLSHYPQLELWSGNLYGARTVALEHIAYAERTGQIGQSAQGLFNLSLAEAHLGNIEEAVSAAAAALDLAEEMEDIYFVGLACWGLGAAHVHGGDPAAGLAPLERAATLRDQIGMKDPGRWRFYPEHVEALLASNDLGGAEKQAELLVKRAEKVDRVSGLATGHRSRALVAAARGDLGEAVTHLQRASEAHERWGNPFERGRTLLTAGQISRRRKAKGEAKVVLEEARSIFDSLGARLWSERVQGEIARLGLRPGAPLELTESERRVAELAAKGLTNKDVAASLFISPKTVEANLAKVYRKLGIRSRAELGALLGSHGN